MDRFNIHTNRVGARGIVALLKMTLTLQFAHPLRPFQSVYVRGNGRHFTSLKCVS